MAYNNNYQAFMNKVVVVLTLSFIYDMLTNLSETFCSWGLEKCRFLSACVGSKRLSTSYNTFKKKILVCVSFSLIIYVDPDYVMKPKDI